MDEIWVAGQLTVNPTSSTCLNSSLRCDTARAYKPAALEAIVRGNRGKESVLRPNGFWLREVGFLSTIFETKIILQLLDSHGLQRLTELEKTTKFCARHLRRQQ